MQDFTHRAAAVCTLSLLVLALRALREQDVKHEVALARDGVEASDFLFGTADAEAQPLPIVVFLFPLWALYGNPHLPKLTVLVLVAAPLVVAYAVHFLIEKPFVPATARRVEPAFASSLVPAGA